MNLHSLKRLLPLSLALACLSCTGLPDQVTPVTPFDAQRYLGTWYEIARLDHSFERGLSRVTAQYSLREDGGIRVVNRGYNAESGQWSSAEGRAYFVDKPTTAHLKVSFFGPFYASYAVFALAPDYDLALVSGHNQDYLWLLARSPEIDEARRQAFLAKAQASGFDTSQLIWVEHE